jgi:hypothetical protein
MEKGMAMRKEVNPLIFIKKIILIVSVCSICAHSLAQRPDWRTRIDEKVQWADSLSLKSQKVFYLNKFLKGDRPVKETWYYTIQDGKIIIFEIKYVTDSTEFSEIYYLDNGRLICMEEYQVPYLSEYADQVKHGAALFFDHDDLRQYVVTGKDKGDLRFNRASESLQQFEKRYEELKKTIQYEPSRN